MLLNDLIDADAMHRAVATSTFRRQSGSIGFVLVTV